MSLRRILAVIAPLLAMVFITAACSGSSTGGGDLPAGADLLKKSAEATKGAKSAAFTLETTGKPPVPVKRGEGRVSATGDADGKLQLDFLGTLTEVNFVLVGDKVHFKGPTGGYQIMTRQELAAIYDPSVILNPAQGVAQLMSTASDVHTEAAEQVAGADAYRVRAALSQQVLAKLIPGVTQGVNGKLWIDKASGRLLKVSLPLGSGGNAGEVTVSFRDYDAPVQVTPPAE
ncbi:LppX_LprAFG lipoprotein [Sinosporangium siamense]|uniref:Lipoprotein LprG n=1 Tax=Sinosporangium siamense TaxID=1367973 RepID=A0A919V7S4_9ACTN|nr:LppX_LprAFG lipoprotein [Sinosporangium siamense]GII92417.1 hypothetical protein Ssi02_26480 [Sinosporangium siamense]